MTPRPQAITLPWTTGLPSADAVREHAERWPMPTQTTWYWWPSTGAAWLLREDQHGIATIGHLRCVDGNVERWNEEEHAWESAVDHGACLPIITNGIPVALLPDIDPRQEPIRHVSTVDARGAVGWLTRLVANCTRDDDAWNAQRESMHGALFSVIAERDHYLADRGNMQRAMTALVERARTAERSLQEERDDRQDIARERSEHD